VALGVLTRDQRPLVHRAVGQASPGRYSPREADTLDEVCLSEAAERGLSWSGDPVRDWLGARSMLEGIDALGEILTASKMIRLFRATDVLASGLSDLWLSQGEFGAPRPL
jgi:hypothetical protein